MRSESFKRWAPAVFAVACWFGAVVVNYLSGRVVFATILAVLFLVIGWWSWPGRRGAHIPHAEAQAAAGDDDLIVYWRPG